MAVLFLLLAIVGCVVVGDLVMENPGPGDVTVFNQPISGYPQGVLLAVAAGLGFLVGLLAVGSVGLRRSRRERRQELRTAERELGEELSELESENARLRDELSRRDRAARLRSDPDLSFLDDRVRARQAGPRSDRPQGP
jgi:lipopolysaccharide assembly LapA-like protein